jgi:hypothetical protein
MINPYQSPEASAPKKGANGLPATPGEQLVWRIGLYISLVLFIFLALGIAGAIGNQAPMSIDWNYVRWEARLPLLIMNNWPTCVVLIAAISLIAVCGYGVRLCGGRSTLLWVHGMLTALLAVFCLIVWPVWMTILGDVRIQDNLWTDFHRGTSVLTNVSAMTFFAVPTLYAIAASRWLRKR